MSNSLKNFKDNILTKFHPVYRKHVKEILLDGNVGLNNMVYKDISLFDSKFYTLDYEDEDDFKYIFNFKVSYVAKKLTWGVIFNPDRIEYAPDFVFEDNSFDNDDIDAVAEYVPALVNWDVNDPTALKLVLEQYLNLYKICEIKKIQEEQISSQIKCLISDENFSMNDFEIFLKDSTVHILIRIKVNCENLPQYLQQSEEEIQNPGEDAAFISVNFIKLYSTRVTTNLCLSARLEQILGNSKTLNVPKYGRCTILITYVTSVKTLLSDLIKQAKESYKYRKTLVTYLITLKKSAVTEYDSYEFKKLILLFNVNDYYCLVQIELENNFPSEQPIVRLYSVYCLNLKNPCFKDVTNLPYCSSWTCEEFAEQLFNFFKEAILDFKNHKH